MSLKTSFASSLLKINTLVKVIFANQFILSINIHEPKAFSIIQFANSDQIKLSLQKVYRSVAFGKPEEESPDNVECHTV
jgi:hypothetical protein